MAGVVLPKLKGQNPKCNIKLFYYYLLFHSFIPSVRLMQFISILAKLLLPYFCFPCGVGRVGSRLFSKSVGLYRKIIYVGGL
jgi:hypothetical protein